MSRARKLTRREKAKLKKAREERRDRLARNIEFARQQGDDGSHDTYAHVAARLAGTPVTNHLRGLQEHFNRLAHEQLQETTRPYGQGRIPAESAEWLRERMDEVRNRYDDHLTDAIVYGQAHLRWHEQAMLPVPTDRFVWVDDNPRPELEHFTFDMRQRSPGVVQGTISVDLVHGHEQAGDMFQRCLQMLKQTCERYGAREWDLIFAVPQVWLDRYREWLYDTNRLLRNELPGRGPWEILGCPVFTFSHDTDFMVAVDLRHVTNIDELRGVRWASPELRAWLEQRLPPRPEPSSYHLYQQARRMGGWARAFQDVRDEAQNSYRMQWDEVGGLRQAEPLPPTKELTAALDEMWGRVCESFA